MKYKVVLKKSKEGFSVSCPGYQVAGPKAGLRSKGSKTSSQRFAKYLEVVDKLAERSRVREVEVSV